MKPADKYFRFVLWCEEDQVYVGYCPDLFPWGGVCHASSEQETYGELCGLVQAEVAELTETGESLPEPQTRPMREAVR